MSAIEAHDELLSVEEYLASEEHVLTKREYLGGIVYEMGGASRTHDTIVGNVRLALREVLRGMKCRFHGPEVKLNFSVVGAEYFYYPDGMVVCDPTDADDRFCERPAVVFEVISESTRAIDEREKRDTYHRLPSVQAYARIEQHRPEVVIEVRTTRGWKLTRIHGLERVVDLGYSGLALPLSRVYEDIVFPV
ncbi:MAG TPA: Uma2 family endonuclease [Chthoniobacteraceae bacterium]|jgi:Uma2 family endonuclease|nr:Uma2 family endonuclease [Chthoniobacteraceae bacterium]